MTEKSSLARLGQHGVDHVPRGWKQSRVKYLAKYTNGYPFKPTEWGTVGRPIIRIQNLGGSASEMNRFSGEVNPRYLVRGGDILISWSASLGVYRWFGEDAWLNQHIFKVRVNHSRLSEEYFFWLAEWFMSELRQAVHGSTMQHLTDDAFGGFPVLIPPASEQRALSAFLFSETARTEALIEKHERLLMLLREKWFIVLSHVISRGIDDAVPLKETAVPWLGPVPDHWSVKRLKHISPRLGVGVVVNPSRYFAEEGAYFLHGFNVTESGLRLDGARRISVRDSSSLPESRLSTGDVVSVRVGFPGVTAVVPPELEGSNCASLMVIRKGKFNSRWLSYAMNSSIGKQQVAAVQYGAAQKVLNIGAAANLAFPVPPRNEQDEIVDHLDSLREEFADVTSAAHKMIDLLKERRFAVVSSAVTGQLDADRLDPRSVADRVRAMGD